MSVRQAMETHQQFPAAPPRNGSGRRVGKPRLNRWRALLLAGALMVGAGSRSIAQPAPPAGTTPASAPAGAAEDRDGITLNFPDNVELKILVDYVSQRLGINIVYQDELVASQRVTVRSPGKVPPAALLPLIESLLKTRGLVLVDGDHPGWKRLVPMAAAAVAAVPGQPAAAPGQVVTQVFVLQHLDGQRLDQILKPFLSTPGASSFGVSEQHLELVTDYASNLPRIEGLIRLLDQPNRSSRIEFVAVKHADGAQLAQQVKQILQAQAKSQTAPGQAPESPVEVASDKRTNQLIVVGPPDDVGQAMQIVKALDTEVAEQQSPVRFYKLANATADDVLETIRALEGQGSGTPRHRAGAAGGQGSSTPGINGTMPSGVRAPNLNQPGGVGAAGISVAPSLATTPAGGNTGGSPTGYPAPAAAPDGAAPRAPADNTGAPAPGAPEPVRTKQAVVAADPNTNSIIVIAEAPVQKLYEQLILNLDKRRPQVLIECTIASIDTTDNFQIGVEIAAHSKQGKDQVITFSNFGLSTPDPKTGQLALVPGAGFNGAVLSADVADVILHALQQNSRVKVTSAPRVLVNDNATGTLSSLSEQPFTANNFNNTVSTTSFGGYAEAGTQVTLTPHISEADYLQLEYTISLSSFTGKGNASQGIPPPRQTDEVASRVTIPDGSTVIIGGLNRSNYSRSVDSIPLLGQIPVLNYLFSNRNDTTERVTLFVFLRPIILRDDQFKDLKFLSERDLSTAGLPGNFPRSEPIALP